MTVTDAELETLASSHDIISLGMAADEVRRRLHGTRTTFVRVLEVDATPGGPVELVPTAGEVRIVGAPASRTAALQRIAEVVKAAGSTPVSGFTLSELEQLAAAEEMPLRAVLEDFKAAGLELIAEAPFDRLRNPRLAIEEVNIAGLALARLTIHALPSADVPALYRQIAGLQYDVGVVHAFAPLPRTMNPAVPTTGYDDVRRVALARLFVANIPSIQVDWSLYGPKLTQVALTVGADDLDAVSPHDDTSQGRRRAPLEDVRRNISAAGLEPAERNGRFDAIAR
jgi:aminodeoxyfutalosine synthase